MHKYDMLIIGSGLAGLSFALKAAESARVAVITKNELKETNTWYAQGGIAGVMDLNHDSFEKHIQDTLVAGAGLCDTNAVSKMVYKAPQLIQELVDYGVGFTRKGDELDLGKEGGHSENRIVHAADATGREVENVLAKRVKNHPNIDVYEYFFAMELHRQLRGETLLFPFCRALSLVGVWLPALLGWLPSTPLHWRKADEMDRLSTGGVRYRNNWTAVL